MAVAIVFVLVTTVLSLYPTAQAHAQESSDTETSIEVGAADLSNRQATEFSTVTWDLYTTAAGTPSFFEGSVTSSADVETLVVDIYVDDILVDSVEDPEIITVDLAAHSANPASTSISLIGREASPGECDRQDAVISYRNVSLERIPHAPLVLADAVQVTVTGDDPVAVANLAAAVELELVVPNATVASDASVTIEAVSSDEGTSTDTATVTGLPDQVSFSVSTPTDAGSGQMRTIQRSDIALDRFGGSTFVSASGFGGRVGPMELSGDIHSTPLAAGGGFAIEVNDVVIASGNIDEDGTGTFTTTVQEWPRDAQVAVRLALREDRISCSVPATGYTGTASLQFVPLPSSFGALTVADFPQKFLESDTIALWVDDDVSPESVAVAIAAIQDTSDELLHFHAAADAASSALRLSVGSGATSVVDSTLVMQLDEDSLAELSVDRFWKVGLETAADETSLTTDVISIEPAGLESPRAGWPLTVAIALAAIAVLVLFKKNSRQAP